uniref:Uncharacterized protein n=1 Tax=Chinchilla lanigera TaxID=34839 RepID=A0A8C2V1I6_CHILA
TSVSSQGS